MLDNKGFDMWADGYDKSVGVCDGSNSYPFAGYKNILNTIYNVVLDKDEASVLDIGFGTGTLTKKLYEQGCRVVGVDFSHEMMRIGRALLKCLHTDGQIIIGDVAFENRMLLNSCKKACGDEWDEDEFYFVYDELKEHFKDKVTFRKFSFCTGILTITR